MLCRIRSRRAGFTLIELLVVIAIIAILAAILFPVFARARAQARKINGVSNTKQTSLAVLMYAQDYDEHFPRSGWGGFINAAGQQNQYGTLEWQNVTAPYIKNQGIYQDPADFSDRDTSQVGGDDLMVGPDGHESLLLNDLLSHAAVQEGGQWTFDPKDSGLQNTQRTSNPVTVSGVNAPSDCVLMAEGHCGWVKGDDPAPDWTGNTAVHSKWKREMSMSQFQTELIAATSYNGWHFMKSGTLPIHGDQGVFAFTDGHAKTVKVIDGSGNPVMRGTLPFPKHMDPAQQGINLDPNTLATGYNWQ
jgi:prepilin-type N-terminal cleavage/methylation domain-containing protein